MMLPAVPWIGSTMIAATSLVVSSSIFRARNSTQFQEQAAVCWPGGQIGQIA